MCITYICECVSFFILKYQTWGFIKRFWTLYLEKSARIPRDEDFWLAHLVYFHYRAGSLSFDPPELIIY